MLTISADLSSLSQVQREALSAFILDRAAVPAHESEPKPTWATLEAPVATRKVFLSAEVELSPEQAFASAADVTPVPDALIPPVPQVSSSTLDKAGLPWDERIHSSSKNFTADGSWRKKRGVTDGVVFEVEAQLRNLMGIPEPTPAAPITANPSTWPAPTPRGIIQTSRIPEVAQASVPPPPPPAAPGPALVPTPADMDARQAYIKLVGSASKAMQEQKLSKEEMQVILDKYGVPTLPLLMTARPDLIPTVAMELEAILVTR